MKDSQVLPLIWWQKDMLESFNLSIISVDQSKDTKNLMSLGQSRPAENFFEAKKKDKYEVCKTP